MSMSRANLGSHFQLQWVDAHTHKVQAFMVRATNAAMTAEAWLWHKAVDDHHGQQEE